MNLNVKKIILIISNCFVSKVIIIFIIITIIIIIIILAIFCHYSDNSWLVIPAITITILWPSLFLYKGPEISIEEPDVDFGLVRLGESAKREITLTNLAQVITTWSIQDVSENNSDDAMVSYCTNSKWISIVFLMYFQ